MKLNFTECTFPGGFKSDCGNYIIEAQDSGIFEVWFVSGSDSSQLITAARDWDSAKSEAQTHADQNTTTLRIRKGNLRWEDRA